MRQGLNVYEEWRLRLIAVPEKKPVALNTVDRRIVIPKTIRMSKDARREVRT